MSALKFLVQRLLWQTREKEYQRLLQKSRDEYETRKNADDAVANQALQTPAFCTCEPAENSDSVWVSIIIPSKDNPEMLARCLQSIRETCGGTVPEQGECHREQAVQQPGNVGPITGIEIIVTDNGSTSENRSKINDILNNLFSDNAFFKTRYLYEREDFNFSRMCNRGAKAATGDLLLFLNDDVEALTPGWMSRLSVVALAKGTGAVGAKLLYPNEVGAHKIQHCGIVNTRVGPIHVFGRLRDDETYADGYNRHVVPAIAVTGACLMICRELFEDVGGFYEELPVAFNDVDLCYTLVERGLVNYCVNDMALLHYESFSRGDDSIHAEKRLRLMREYRTLMRRHKTLIGVEPFFPKTAFTQEKKPFPDRTVTDAFDADRLLPSRLQPFVIPPSAREDRVLFYATEFLDKLWLWTGANGVNEVQSTAIRTLSQEEAFFVWGYAFVIGSDNALYKKTLLFKKVEPDGTGFRETDEEILACPVHTAYRPDIALRIPDQIHAQMCGFYAKIAAEDLPASLYKIGIMAEKVFSSEKLLCWNNYLLLTEKT